MKNLVISALFLFIFIGFVSAYTVHIDAPAVIVNADQGVLTSVSLNVTSGNGNVSVNTGSPQGSVGIDTLESAQIAVNYSASYLSINKNKFNFNFTIESNDSNVSGPSAGLAMTLLAVAALEHRQLNPNFTVTGTISANGSVGQIGGVFDKVQAAKSINAKYILVPYLNQNDYQYLLYYLSQQTYGIPVIEIKNASQAVPYALGNPKITPLSYTFYTDYKPNGLPQANITCSSCNDSAFQHLTNFTFNFTQNEINGMNSAKFSNIQSQMQRQLAEYSQIESKGYFYSAADLAFIEFPTSYVFYNYNASNSTNALQVLNTISDYCNSVNASPTVTNTNYEYVYGAQARRLWAESTLATAYIDLNNSQTSDDVLAVVQSAAPAYSWCLAAGEMNNIASSLGGSPVALSSSVAAKIRQEFRNAPTSSYGLLYVNASQRAYDRGEYGAALYSIQYAKVFYNSSNISNKIANSTVSNTVVKAALSPNGTWPQQFALQSRFYLYEASVSSGANASGYVQNAYDTALLSISLSNLNSYFQKNFVAAPNATIGNSIAIANQIAQLNSNITLIFYALIVLIVLISLTLISLLLHLLSHKTNSNQQASQQSQNTTASATKKSARKKMDDDA